MRLAYALVLAFMLPHNASAQAVQTPDMRGQALSPASVRSQQRLKEGQRLMAEDKFAEAAAAFEEALAIDPLLMMAHYGLGTARMALKEYPAAILAFRAARDAFDKRTDELANKRFEAQSAREDRIRVLQQTIRNYTATNRFEQAQRQEWESELQALESAQEASQRGSQPPRACPSPSAARTSAPGSSPMPSASTAPPSRLSPSSASRASTLRWSS